MRTGLHVLGIGAGADPAVIEAVARSAESAGFSTLWSGEHIVMVDRADSPYPYSDDKRIAVPSDADWLDPLLALSFASAFTTRIRLATGILLLPEHNPVLVAKQTASLDVLSRGRFLLGIGIGWSAAEFEALGLPFAGRARRTRECVEVLRALWRDDVSSYEGEFFGFSDVRSYPKPVRGRQIPIAMGGNSDAALRRVADYADGWYGFNLAMDEIPERTGTLRSYCSEIGRNPDTVEITVSLRDGGPEDVEALTRHGVSELAVVESPPEDPASVEEWIAGLAARWGVTVRRVGR